ncbi:MAG: aldehyde dehydrogenase family protein [Chromatiales bacterium]|nr:aldehyde dehydrogenase family protein [Chromatiales bacterium]
MPGDWPIWLAGRACRTSEPLAVHDKFSGQACAQTFLAGPAELEAAIAAAESAAAPMRRLRPWRRAEVLRHCAQRFEARAGELARLLCTEAGKPITDSEGEVARLVETFQIAAAEALRNGGEVLELETSERSDGYRGFTQRVPVGPCGFISPFNFPLNLAAHKVAPAIAAGCPFVLKPASLTPLGALLIGEVLAETGLPPGAFSILPCARTVAEPLATDPRLRLLSFTGSPEAGWALKARAVRKSVVLELGGNAACIVDEGTDIDDAVDRLLFGIFYQSGQSCISVQRVLLHESLADQLQQKLVAGARALKAGDPGLRETSIGPLISVDAARRLEAWIREAIRTGAELLCGGERDGAILQPTLLRGVRDDQPLWQAEAFGPVAVIETWRDFDEALARVNDSRFGIHAGIFTPRLDRALKAWDELDVGGVLINEVPSWRADGMPYGGVKDSGLGREGVRYAIRHMTQIRSLVIRR